MGFFQEDRVFVETLVMRSNNGQWKRSRLNIKILYNQMMDIQSTNFKISNPYRIILGAINP
ncbi:MAG: hypothetical protein CM15mP111_3030 [Hyphomicrobiales bacterium]|nr:MAG: hypothetical protein CM15mP111_3030 [Hyphomicrobiales bacterium]